jgi:penicillin-binding protein 1A
VTDADGKVLSEARPERAGVDANRVIDERNAWLMDSMLRDVARAGTAAKARADAQAPDLAGKTGTTNDSIDAWFAGYQPHLVGIAWIGYDQPRNLGNKETGGGLALPIWIGFMQKALKDVPVASAKSPPAWCSTATSTITPKTRRAPACSRSTSGRAPAAEQKNRVTR